MPTTAGGAERTEMTMHPPSEEETENDIQESPSISTLSKFQAKVKYTIRKGREAVSKMKRRNKISNLNMKPLLQFERNDYTMKDETIYIGTDDEDEILVPENEELLAKVEFVLVTNKSKTGIDRHEMDRRSYLKTLRHIGFNIMKKEDDYSLFFGIQAPDNLFEKYIQLLNIAERTCSTTGLNTISKSTRIRIINFILWRTTVPNGGSLREFLQNKTFESVFPLHEKLSAHPLLDINNVLTNSVEQSGELVVRYRLYFGERIALYFAWLGWYITMLIPAAICGVLVFLYGMIYFGQGQVSKEICSAHTIIMCPTCDQICPFWRLSDTCAYAKITELFDQEITLYFAMFMGIWATVFLELWKRARMKVISNWDLFDWDEDEEELALGLIYTPDESPAKYQHSYLRTTIVLLLGGVLITIIISIALGIVIFRIVTAVTLTKSSVAVIRENANSVAIIISAVLHFVIVIIMNKVNYIVARKLSQLERKRTVLARENSFTIKMFTFQFVTMFASNVYIAYFLGRINGHPGNYVRIGNKWRLEECHPSGCMTDLLIQMAVVMVLKQVLSTTVDYAVPAFKRRWRKRTRLAHQNVEDVTKHWIKNYSLNEFSSYSFFNEFLEMAIQYGFTTIFVAAFPLAPLLALLNNLFEIRLDARKMIWLLKRPIPQKAKDIGIWLEILEIIGVFAIIGNGLVIAITSDFIPRKVYQYSYSPCAEQKNTSIDCLTGYVNNSLSVYHLKNSDDEFFPLDDGAGLGINHCRYRDYRSEHSQKHTGQFWHIFAARLACLVLFENVAVCVKYLACWFIPNVPASVRNENLKKTYYRLRDELRFLASKTPVTSRSNVPNYQLIV